MSEFGNFIACFHLDSFRAIFGAPYFGIQPHTVTRQHSENSDGGAHVSACRQTDGYMDTQQGKHPRTVLLSGNPGNWLCVFPHFICL